MKRIHFFTIIAVLGLLIVGTAQPASAGGQPDLKVIRVESVYSGGQWYMSYTVKNIGTAYANPFWITLKNRADTPMQSFETKALAPDASRTFLHRTGVCEFYRKILPDSTNAILESNELNNTRTYEHFC